MAAAIDGALDRDIASIRHCLGSGSGTAIKSRAFGLIEKA
jgi:hypothetical protein